MLLFTYEYKGESIKSIVSFSLENGNRRYKVKLPSELWLTIAPFGLTTPGEKTIWLQYHNKHEDMQPHELIQAMGEGVEALG